MMRKLITVFIFLIFFPMLVAAATVTCGTNNVCLQNTDCTCTTNCNGFLFSLYSSLDSFISEWEGSSLSTSITIPKSYLPSSGTKYIKIICYDGGESQRIQLTITPEREVQLGGEIRPVRIFSASNFRSTWQDGSYRIRLDYSNRLEEDVIIILTLSRNGKATNKQYVTRPGDGTASYLVDCEDLTSGTYLISWKAFKSSDNRNPIVWSKLEEMVNIKC